MAYQDSSQVARPKQSPPVINPPGDAGGRVRSFAFDCTQSGAGADGDGYVLAKMPGGKLRMLGVYFENSAYGAARVAALGHGSYIDEDGNQVALDATYFKSGLDIASQGQIDQPLPSATLNTPVGFDLLMTITGGTLPDAGTIRGYALIAVD